MKKTNDKSSNNELKSLYYNLYEKICTIPEIESSFVELLNGIEKFSSERSSELKLLDKSRKKIQLGI